MLSFIDIVLEVLKMYIVVPHPPGNLRPDKPDVSRGNGKSGSVHAINFWG